MTGMEDAPFEPELQALLDAERSAPEPPAGAQARVWGRIDATLAAAPAPAAAAPTGVGVSGVKLTLLVGAVTAAAVVGWQQLQGPQADPEVAVAPAPATASATVAPSVSTPRATPARIATPTAAPAPTHVAAVADAPSAPAAANAEAATLPPQAEKVVAVRVARVRNPALHARRANRISDSPASVHLTPPAAAQAPTAAEDPAATLAAELRLLRTARAAMQQGDGAAAMAQLNEHATRHAAGHLAEEREALAVQALAQLGRMADAQGRAHRFEDRYPRSLMLPAVRAALLER